ncbi:MAG: hypothetical protein H6993_16580 [Pseudomonadales bacterium]|nr:hypothetical protein [Pseudomonadales bacterium]
MKQAVFIHTNNKQIVGAIVGAHALRKYSGDPELDVRFIRTEDYPFLQEHEGRNYLRDGAQRVWLNDDLQSFTPLRFMPPALMGYEGRAVVIDPDVFAVADVRELLNMDMQDKAILCRRRSGTKGAIDKCLATSVMLLDCAKLRHWRVEEQFRSMFESKLDYHDWICLKTEDPQTIGMFDPTWNDFDRLGPDTKMLHTTRRKTQPWKSGLKVDWRPAERFRLFPPIGWLMKARRKLFGEYAFLGNYQEHPDKNQIDLFFGLLQECIDAGLVTDEMLKNEIRQQHVRADVYDVLKRTPQLRDQRFGAAVG